MELDCVPKSNLGVFKGNYVIYMPTTLLQDLYWIIQTNTNGIFIKVSGVKNQCKLVEIKKKLKIAFGDMYELTGWIMGTVQARFKVQLLYIIYNQKIK